MSGFASVVATIACIGLFGLIAGLLVLFWFGIYWIYKHHIKG